MPKIRQRVGKKKYIMENKEQTQVLDNHMTEAVLTMIFCCLPFGIVALIYATKVNKLLKQGREQEAEEASSKANKWIKIAFAFGIGWNLLYLIGVFGREMALLM